MEKFQIMDPHSLGFWFCECWQKWNISVSHYENIEERLLFHKYRSCGKISNYQPPKVWVSGLLSVNRNGILASAIMKKLKNGHHFVNIKCMEKFQITDSPQSLVLQFSECQQKWNISICHYEKIEKWPPFHKYALYGKISNYQPPKVEST